jgi:adenylate cyclase
MTGEPALHASDRRLTAILAADIAGYSRLMGQDEAQTLRDLKGHEAAVLSIIAQFGGGVINIAGDGIVAQFSSAVRAVECAVAIQKKMAERNADAPKDRRMLYRIGVNLGDIVHDGANVYGDGVNVAARLETIAEPGGICLSSTVRDAIFGKLGFPLRDLGDRTFKNIARPVRTFEIQPDGARRRRVWPRLTFRRGMAAALAVALVVGGFAAWRLWPRESAAPDYTPVIAVLPFTNVQGDASLDYLGPSFGREVSAVLSTFPTLRVVSASGGLPPQKLASPRQAARELGANYALEGDVVKTGDKMRIRAQLTDAASGENVWSDSYDFHGEDPTVVQVEVAERIYGAITGINGRIRKIEEEAAWRKPEGALTDYDYYIRAQTYYLRYTPDDNLRARKITEEGLARFPDSPLLKIKLAWTYMIENNGFGPFENCRETAEIAYKYGREAEDAKNKSRFLIWMSRRLMSNAYAWHGADFDRSLLEAEAAIDMAPYDTELRTSTSVYVANAGRVDEAIEWASWAVAHNFQKSPYAKGNLAWAYYLAGRADEALEAIKGVESANLPALAVIYARLGRLEEAKAAVADWLKTGPHSILTESCWPMREPLKRMYIDDLRKAGLPER